MVVGDIREQDAAASAIAKTFNHVVVSDRRLKPSHGYRAIHLIVRVMDQPIEVQIRTTLQHVWAEVSEKLADVVDHSIKYGGGPLAVRELLDRASEQIRQMEEAESVLVRAGGSNGKLAHQLGDVRNGYAAKLQLLLKKLDDPDPDTIP